MFKAKLTYITNIKLYVIVSDVVLHEIGMVESRNVKDGRNIGLVNQVTFEVLEHALSRENRYLSMGELAEGIHHHYEEADKKSAEYKQIKKLLPYEKRTSLRFRYVAPGYFDVKERNDAPQQSIQKVEKSYWEARDKYGQAVYDYEHGKISSDELKVIEESKNAAFKEYRRLTQRYQIYAPNFRGLLLFLYLCKILRLKKDIRNDFKNRPGKTKSKDDTRISTLGKRKYNQTVRKIRRIIGKDHILKKAPFLKYWQDFEKCGFDVIELLLQIAEELHSQLHIDAENDKYLLRRASERYFVEAENYCHERLDDMLYSNYLLLKGKFTPEELNRLAQTRHKYRRHMIPRLKGWIQRQQEVIDYIDDKRKEDDITWDTSFDEDKIILLSDLALKYDTNISKVSKALGLYYNNDPTKPDYYPHDSRQYLVTNTCLIPVHEIDKLKPVLSNGMNFLDVCSLFEKHGIPESCHQEIIPKIGFEIIRMPGDKWDPTRKWFIVERPFGNIESFFRTYLK